MVILTDVLFSLKVALWAYGGHPNPDRYLNLVTQSCGRGSEESQYQFASVANVCFANKARIRKCSLSSYPALHPIIVSTIHLSCSWRIESLAIFALCSQRLKSKSASNQGHLRLSTCERNLSYRQNTNIRKNSRVDTTMKSKFHCKYRITGHRLIYYCPIPNLAKWEAVGTFKNLHSCSWLLKVGWHEPPQFGYMPKTAWL